MRNFIVQNNRIITVGKTESFQRSLERASKIVDSWPEWKKRAAGVYLYSKKGDDPAG